MSVDLWYRLHYERRIIKRKIVAVIYAHEMVDIAVFEEGPAISEKIRDFSLAEGTVYLHIVHGNIEAHEGEEAEQGNTYSLGIEKIHCATNERGRSG